VSFSANLKIYAGLHLLLILYSVAAVFSKFASTKTFLSTGFIVCYGVVLLLLFAYAIGWQQILKRLPLSVAFANKSIVIIWGIVWGMTLFKEKLTLGMVIGSVFVVCGIFFVVSKDD